MSSSITMNIFEFTVLGFDFISFLRLATIITRFLESDLILTKLRLYGDRIGLGFRAGFVDDYLLVPGYPS